MVFKKFPPPSVDLIFQIIEITIYMYISPFINLKLSYFLNLLLKTWFLVMTHLFYAYTIIYLITYLDLDRLFLVFPYYNKTGKTESKLSLCSESFCMHFGQHVFLIKETHFNCIFWLMRNASLYMPKLITANKRRVCENVLLKMGELWLITHF